MDFKRYFHRYAVPLLCKFIIHKTPTKNDIGAIDIRDVKWGIKPASESFGRIIHEENEQGQYDA